MNFDEQGIKELMAGDEAKTRERVIHSDDIKKQISAIKSGLSILDFKEPWQDVSERFDFVRHDFEDLESMLSAIERALKIRAAAIEAKKISEAGFEFAQIEIDGIHLHRTPEGICEDTFFIPENYTPF